MIVFYCVPLQLLLSSFSSLVFTDVCIILVVQGRNDFLAVLNCLGIKNYWKKVIFKSLSNASSMLKSVKSKLCKTFKTNFIFCFVNFFRLSCFHVKIGLTVSNFPVKRLGKNTSAQNTHALLFIFPSFPYSCCR